MNHPTEKLINGEMLTRELLVERHGKLVYLVTSRYKNLKDRLGYEEDDLVSIGNIGLIKAFDNFDNEKYPVRFSTYAVPMIKGEIRRHMRDLHANGLMFSRTSKEIGWMIIKNDLQDEHINVIVEKLDKPKGQVTRALLYLEQRSAQSLDAASDWTDSEDTLINRACGVEDDVTYLYVQDFLSTLSIKEQIVIESLLEGRSQRVIADAINSHQVQVSRIIKKIRAKYLLRGVK